MPREALQRGYFRLTRSITLHRKFSSKMIRPGLGTEREREKEKDHFAILRLRISDGQGLSFPLSPPLPAVYANLRSFNRDIIPRS